MILSKSPLHPDKLPRTTNKSLAVVSFTVYQLSTRPSGHVRAVPAALLVVQGENGPTAHLVQKDAVTNFLSLEDFLGKVNHHLPSAAQSLNHTRLPHTCYSIILATLRLKV